MANANIFQQYLRPVRSVQDHAADMDRADANALALVAQRRQNDLAELQAAQTRAGLADAAAKRNALQRIYSQIGQGADPMARARALQADPLTAAEGVAAEKEALAANKSATENDSAKFKLDQEKRQAAIAQMASFGSAEDAAAHLSEAVGRGEVPMEQAQRMLKAIPRDPQKFREWQLQTIVGLVAPDKRAAMLAPQVQTRNTGGSTDTLAIDPLTGRVSVTNSVRNTQSPDSRASAAVQMRGQNMADARARESAATALSRPFEVTGPDGKPMLVQQDRQGNLSPVAGFGPKAGASKPLNDTQAKALLFGSRMREADKLLEGLAAQGTELPSIVKQGAEAVPLIGGALGVAANMVATPGQQQVEQAQRDFVNAMLRRESGAAILSSEFDDARKQYFPQPGDSAQVKKQKAANRDLAIRGVLAEVPEGQRESVQAAPGASANVDALVDKYRSK